MGSSAGRVVIHIDLESGQLVSTIDVGAGEFGDIAAGDDAVWVTTFDENTVSRIDPTSDEIVAVIEVGANPEDLLVTPNAIWVSNHRDGSLSRIDPATNKVVATVKVGPKGPSGPKEIALVAGDLWTAIPNANGSFGSIPYKRSYLDHRRQLHQFAGWWGRLDLRVVADRGPRIDLGPLDRSNQHGRSRGLPGRIRTGRPVGG